MLIDTMAERYGLLPSQVLNNANTFDVFICDTAIGYRNELSRRANGATDTAPKMSIEQLMEFHTSGKSKSKSIQQANDGS